MAERDTRQFALAVERDMQAWLEGAVIGLNLCPFAKAVHVRGQIRYAVSRAQTPQALAQDLAHELQSLVAIDPELRDTTLLMAPDCLPGFLEFNDFLADANQVLVDLQLDGVIQIASFHPDFQFANTLTDDIGNYTNRAPYPTLHLLREISVDRAVKAFPEAESIFQRNILAMEKLGHAGWAGLGLRRSGPCENAEPSPERRVAR